MSDKTSRPRRVPECTLPTEAEPAGLVRSGQMSRRSALLFATIALLGVAAWIGTSWADAARREDAKAQLFAAVAAANHGQTVDLAQTFPLEWDRAVVLPPYSYGAEANALLGFDHFPADLSLSVSDAVQLLVFARLDTVVQEVELDGQSFYFDEAIRTFRADAASFEVDRSGSVPTLHRAV